MTTRKTFPLLAALLCMALLLGGCKPASPAGLSDDQVKQVTENILVSVNTNDYSGFIEGYSEDLLTASPESQFDQLRSVLLEASGNFIRCADQPDLSNQATYAVYEFQCEFEKETVRVTIVFEIDGSLVEGLFFDSPGLRAVKP